VVNKVATGFTGLKTCVDVFLTNPDNIVSHDDPSFTRSRVLVRRKAM
jgi:hypothetical protein